MACGSRRVSEPVQISLKASAALAESRKRREKPPVHKVVEFHCDKCPYHGLSEKHVCEPREASWITTRRNTCNRCPYKSDDLCTLYKSIHPDRDCSIGVGIELPYSRCPAGLWPRVELTCDQCQSVTFNERGVHKCKSCGWTPKTTTKLPHVVRLKDEEPFAATSKFAVVTLATGFEAQQLHELTGPRMSDYASQCGADFHVIKDDLSPSYPLANKFRLATLTANYERVLFLDADVWIKPTAPNIFETYESGYVYLHPDVTRHDPLPRFATEEMRRICKEQQLPEFESRCLNSGVVLFDGDKRSIWTAPALPLATRHIAEQMWVESRIVLNQVPQRDLDSRWNWQYYFDDFDAGEDAAYFIHLASCQHGERIYRLRKLAHFSSK